MNLTSNFCPFFNGGDLHAPKMCPEGKRRWEGYWFLGGKSPRGHFAKKKPVKKKGRGLIKSFLQEKNCYIKKNLSEKKPNQGGGKGKVLGFFF